MSTIESSPQVSPSHRGSSSSVANMDDASHGAHALRAIKKGNVESANVVERYSRERSVNSLSNTAPDDVMRPATIANIHSEGMPKFRQPQHKIGIDLEVVYRMWLRIVSFIMLAPMREGDQEDIGGRTFRAIGATVALMVSNELVHVQVGGGDVAQPLFAFESQQPQIALEERAAKGCRKRQTGTLEREDEHGPLEDKGGEAKTRSLFLEIRRLKPKPTICSSEIPVCKCADIVRNCPVPSD
ncbi:hypothetical protein ARMSODRAFT_979398 [Armillaria solidipes]|uniref:Uncharacterized protein n=1 Tax=Armillaria solidipes TaxID=1076256 RepID=A0A2H3AZD1_9AGAR|nr:hypothetical protein ARMSODRAFT_979398 [Armillaria solidipes]